MPKNKTTLEQDAKFTYLGDIIHLHSIYENLLTQKIGFIVAVAALVVTVGFSLILGTDYANYSIWIQLAILTPAIGATITIIIAVSSEQAERIKKVQTFHPLSIPEFHDEAKNQFVKDITSLLKSETDIVTDYSNQILHMKEDIFKRNNAIKWAINILVSSLFIMTLFICIQLYLSLLI